MEPAFPTCGTGCIATLPPVWVRLRPPDAPPDIMHWIEDIPGGAVCAPDFYEQRRETGAT